MRDETRQILKSASKTMFPAAKNAIRAKATAIPTNSRSTRAKDKESRFIWLI